MNRMFNGFIAKFSSFAAVAALALCACNEQKTEKTAAEQAAAQPAASKSLVVFYSQNGAT